MTDVVDAATRSRMMSGIRNRNTRPELVIRRGLHALGFRYRVTPKDLPGKPDLVFPRYRAVIFVHGCFWHVHECVQFRWPESRADFWREKLGANRLRDTRTISALEQAGWKVLVIWECETRVAPDATVNKCAEWLRNARPCPTPSTRAQGLRPI